MATTACANGYACSYYITPISLHYEGEGDGLKSYTCGPASTRNLVQTMTGHDYGENQFSIWENTTTNGTAIGNIASALNTHFSNWDTFGIFHVTSTSALLINTQAIVGEYGHEYVQNVATGALDFWNGHNLHHYDGVYGWTQTQVDVSEEWNPIKIYGSSSYGNPFGEHAEALSKDLTAVNTSPSGQFVG